MTSRDMEKEGTAHGLEYEVVATSMGHRCGYVRIPEGHILFGRCYNDVAPGVTREDLEDEPMGKRGIITLFCSGLGSGNEVNLELVFDVHGSLTFSGPRHSKQDWWLGFDCGHAGDGRDPSLMSEYRRRFFDEWENGDDPIRTTEYVEEECVSLARQIADRYPLEEQKEAAK